MNGRWFRLYSDILLDPKIKKLSDKDFRLWINLLCVAADNDGRIPPLDDLKHTLNKRLDHLSTGVERLLRGGLIVPLEGGYAPHAWDKRQYKSQSIGDPKGHKAYVYFAGSSLKDEIKIGYSKNPWARVKDMQTGNSKPIKVIATVKTDEVSERDILERFAYCRTHGEWHRPDQKLLGLIEAIRRKGVTTHADIINYVATTKEAEAETETESRGAGAQSNLAFLGRTIRLTTSDYQRWQKSYSAIPDLNAELTKADDYYTENPPPNGKWFFAVSRWLDKAHKDARSGKREVGFVTVAL